MLALIPALGVLSACATGPDAAEPPLGEVEEIRVVTELALPLDLYVLNADQRARMLRAEEMLRARCMIQFGFDKPASTQTPRPPSRARLYGVSDPDLVTRWGYRAPGEQSEAPADQEPSPEEVAVTTGSGEGMFKGLVVPEGGCIGEARRALAGGLPEDEFVQQLTREAFQRAGDDERVRQVFAKWSDCMREAGFHYRDPWTAINNPIWQQSTDPTPTEIATASADVRCRHTLNVHGIWYAVNIAHEKHIIKENTDKLEHAKRSVTNRHELAKTILGD